MEHLAIMKKSWKLTGKIINGQKTIESRWYMSKYAPWDRIHEGETIYFKDSGDPVTIKADVGKVLQFSNLNPKTAKEILSKYSNRLGIEPPEEFYKLIKDKKYCILIFMKNPKAIEPFEISKKGFGLMSAWISLESIDKIRLR